MKLLLNATSPYARMARIAILEKDLTNHVALVWSDPWSDDEYLLSNNPVGRVPTLMTKSGVSISESLLIAQYFDARFKEKPLIPQDRIEQVLHLVGLGHGLMDAAFLTVVSRKYLSNEAENSVLSKLRYQAIQRTISHLGQAITLNSPQSSVSLGDIAIAVALEYVDFRLPELNTTKNYPKLDDWLANIANRASFRATAFQ